MRRVEFIDNAEQKENIARTVLEQLPEWFGLPDSTKEYIENSKNMPFWVCLDGEDPVGFIALKETSTATAEIYVMGILKELFDLYNVLSRQILLPLFYRRRKRLGEVTAQGEKAPKRQSQS